MKWVRDQTVDLLEDLFQPYLDSRAGTIQERREAFGLIVDAAIDFGMQVLAVHTAKFEYRWGERQRNRLMMYPSLYIMYQTGITKGEEERIFTSHEVTVVMDGIGD